MASITLKLRLGLWSLPGALLGAIGGFVTGLGPLAVVLGAGVGAALVYGLSSMMVGGAGKAAGTLHNPSGRSTPHAREHSAAESLVVRGRYEEAVQAFEAAVSEDPRDPVPYLRLARIHRDHLGR